MLEEAAEERIRSYYRNMILTIRDIEGHKLKADLSVAHMIARTILHEDLGHFCEEGDRPTLYTLDDDTKDRLLAHARQDSAHAVILATDAVKRASTLLQWSIICTFLCLSNTSLLLYMLFS